MKKSVWVVFAVALFFGVIVSSCKYSSQNQEINAGNKFSLSLPSWVNKETNLKPGSDIQFANRYRNFYVIGVAMDKDTIKESLNDLMGNNLAILKKALKNPVVSDSSAVVIGGVPGIRVELFGKMDGEDIYFSEVTMGGAKRFYHLSIWTRGANRKLKFKEDINRILESFKEIQK